MRCPACSQDNPQGASFCEECGTQLQPTCPSCGSEVRVGARFCRSCGAAITPPAPAPPSLAGQPLPAPQTRSPHPTAFVNGRYQVVRFLGEGGKKRVYLAHDAVLDRDVAFALIKTENLDEASRSRIFREAQAMGRLGDHPHIVQIYDMGQEPSTGSGQGRGQPYMILPLMPGGDVEGLIEKLPDHKLPIERAVQVAKDVCRGLDFAHSQGFIHRDLKPGNVWLTREGTVKIGDFGLAVTLDRSRLTAEGMMVGTVAYMPPEQALGGEVTPQADLYSLGAMLYEMVTGRPPFLGDDPIAIIGQHINTPPVAPTWHNGQCPRVLEALIMRLLAKDPGERPASAGQVLAALEAIDITQVEAPLEREAQVLDSLAGGVFVGRQREIGELKAALEEALSGRGRLVCLVGEPGIGKTRTAQELATYAGLRQCQVLWGRCYEGVGAPAYWPWVQAVRSYVREREAEEVRSAMGAGAADIAEIVSDVKERLPDLKPPPQLEPEQARFRLFDSFTAFLKGAGRRQPLVLVLEDLHWADRPSLLLLEFLAREFSNACLLVIGTYRDVEVSRGHPLSQSLGELTRERLFQRVLLRGLSQEDVGRFIELVSGVTPPSGMVESVYRQTEGNPLFVTEVVRLLVQEGQVVGAPRQVGAVPLRDSDTWAMRIPEGVREVIGRRLDRLSERCNQTLTIASVIGREFSQGQLHRLIDDMSEDRLLEVLEEALAAKVIEELPRSVGRYQFTHALMQETLVEELTTTRRVRLHARIAQALEELYGDDAPAQAAELAHHFAEAQTVLGTTKLVRYSLLAGERALTGYAYEEAMAHFQRALAAKGVPLTASEPAKDSEAAALLAGLGRSQVATLPVYQLQGAVSLLSRAFEYYAAVGDVDRAVAIASTPTPVAAGYRTGMAQLINRALALVPPDSVQEGRLLSLYGRLLGTEEGDYEGAQRALDRAQAIAQRQGDVALELRALADAAETTGYRNRLQEALEKALRATELAASADDPRSEMLAHYWAALSLVCMGQPNGAEPHAAASVAAAERLRHHFYLSRALFAQECLAGCRGQWQAVRQLNDRGLGVSSLESRQLRYRVMLECELGNFKESEAYQERLLDVMRLTPPGPTIDRAFAAIVIPVAGRITGLTERLDMAKEAAETILSYPSASPLLAVVASAGLGLLAVLRGNAAAAEQCHTALAHAQSMAILIIVGIQEDRLLGLLSHTMGNLDQAAEHFEDALAFCRKAGYRPELAWTCCDYADTLLNPVGAAPEPALSLSNGGRSGHPPRLVGAPTDPANRAKAMSLLDEALRISRELGMRPLMERVLARRQILSA